MIVQLLESETSGKAKKYERAGPQEFVEFCYDEVTIENMKVACNKHFKDRLLPGMSCDILAGERGPSCSKTSHMPNFKVIHVRFVKEGDGISSSSSSCISSEVLERPAFMRPLHFKSQSSTTKSTFPSVYPKSISISTMLKLGKVISKTERPAESIEISEFDIGKMQWSVQKAAKFVIEETPFAQGGFRSVFKATSEGKDYVVKYFLDDTIEEMNNINQNLANKESPETMARKAVQMHMLAKHFSEQMSAQVRASTTTKLLFGKTFQYNKAMLGKIQDKYVTVEEFINGTFVKYVNNNGTVCIQKSVSSLQAKAECLAHYSYMKSDKQLILLDIQGCGYTLFDPEVASLSSIFDEGGLLFCLGNLSFAASENFFQQHSCNIYCNYL